MFRLTQSSALPKQVCSRWMSALTFEAFGEPSRVLKAADSAALAEPASGQVKVALKACPVTAEDIRALRGISVHRSSSGIAGSFGVGTVSSVGAGVVGVSPASQVFVASNSGTWTSEALLSSQEVFSIDSIDLSQAACLPEAASAWALLHNFASLSAGDVVLRSSEPSALNSAIDQIAKAEGIVVVAASEADLIDTKFKEKVATKGNVKLAITSGTGKSARAMHALTGKNGVLVTYNGSIAPMSDTFSGIEIPSLSLIFQNKAVCGFDFQAWVSNSPAEASQAISESVKLIQNGKLNFSPKIFKAAQYTDAVDTASSGTCAVIEL